METNELKAIFTGLLAMFVIVLLVAMIGNAMAHTTCAREDNCSKRCDTGTVVRKTKTLLQIGDVVVPLSELNRIVYDKGRLKIHTVSDRDYHSYITMTRCEAMGLLKKVME